MDLWCKDLGLDLSKFSESDSDISIIITLVKKKSGSLAS